MQSYVVVYLQPKAGFMLLLKYCNYLKKLGPLAGSKICKGQCEKLNIFPGTLQNYALGG